MKRAARSPLRHRLLFALSVLLCVGTCALWVHGLLAALRLNILARGTVGLQITSTWGSIDVAWLWPASTITASGVSMNTWDNMGSQLLHTRRWSYVVESGMRRPGLHRVGPGTSAPGSQGVTWVMLPHWLLVAFFAGAATLSAGLGRRARARRRWIHGECPACGYDLTGNTSGTCPECGARTKEFLGESEIRIPVRAPGGGVAGGASEGDRRLPADHS